MEAPPQQSFLLWTVRSLGFDALLIPLACLIVFALTVLLVVRGRNPMAGAAIVVLLPAPVLWALFSFLRGSIASFAVIANSDVAIKASEFYEGLASGLLCVLVAMLLTIPSYLVAMIGLTIRGLQSPAPAPVAEVDATRHPRAA